MRFRLVLDTNVIISGLLFGGLPLRILELALEGRVVLIASAEMAEELEQVLRTKFSQHRLAILETLAALQDLATPVVPHQRISAIPQDPTDNRVLECALSGRADAVISGDRHLLALKQFRGIPILSPRSFLTQFLKKR